MKSLSGAVLLIAFVVVSVFYLNSASLQSDLVQADVTSVIDGDTLEVMIDGKTQVVNLSGVDAPQLELDMCYARATKVYVEEQVLAKTIWLREYDRIEDVLYAEVFLDAEGAENLNRTMILEGWAVSLSSRYRSLQDTALAEQNGLWFDCMFGGLEEVVILTIDYEGDDESVTLMNINDYPINVRNWFLISMPWDDEGQYCKLPNIEIETSAQIEIHSGPAAVEDQQTSYLCSDQEIWHDDGDMAWLFSHKGKIHSFVRYKDGYVHQ
jgi:endonuclease YncB( thermonuclease family)